MNIERKVCFDSNLEIKGAMGEPGTISGYAATFGNLDRVGDIIVKGAFSDDLGELLRDGVILARHGKDTEQPIATITNAYEDERGLFMEAAFHTTPLAQQERTIAQERMERGKSVSFSIGYVPKEGGVEHTAEARMLKKLKTYEVSLVNIPANPMALATGVKDAGLDDTEEAVGESQPEESYQPEQPIEEAGELADGEKSLAGLTYADQSSAVLAAADAFTTRTKGLLDLCLKEGRKISAARMARIEETVSGLEETHAALSERIKALRELMQEASPQQAQEDEAASEEKAAQVLADALAAIFRADEIFTTQRIGN